MTRLFTAVLLLALGATAASAQMTAGANNSPLAAVGANWKSATNYILQSAKDMPEDKYGYQPTPEVRTFGQLIGHVAGAERMFCAIGMGEAPTGEADIEKTVHDKAGLIKALEESMAYCDKAYAQPDAATQASVDLFGQKVTRFYALVMNATHNGEHYGNIVTYLRMNGMVPPSSRRGM